MILRFAADLTVPFSNNQAERTRDRSRSSSGPPAAAGEPSLSGYPDETSDNDKNWSELMDHLFSSVASSKRAGVSLPDLSIGQNEFVPALSDVCPTDHEIDLQLLTYEQQLELHEPLGPK